MRMDEPYDVFLSHGSPDKPWVESLACELEGLGLPARFRQETRAVQANAHRSRRMAATPSTRRGTC